jgi:hypothetical protein
MGPVSGLWPLYESERAYIPTDSGSPASQMRHAVRQQAAALIGVHAAATPPATSYQPHRSPIARQGQSEPL